MATPQELLENLNARMAAIGLSLTDLSELSQISVPHLSHFLSGRRKLSIQDVSLIHNLMTDLEEVAKICHPIPVNFRNVEMIRALLPKIVANQLPLNSDDDGVNVSRARIIVTTLGAIRDFQQGIKELEAAHDELTAARSLK